MNRMNHLPSCRSNNTCCELPTVCRKGMVRTVSVNPRLRVRMLWLLACCWCAWIGGNAHAALSQSGDDSFDTVAIHPSDPAVTRDNLNLNPGTMSALGITVSELIERAYGIQQYQILGLPAKIGGSRWDLIAKVTKHGGEGLVASSEPAPDEKTLLQRRLQIILKQRFGLQLHIVEKPGPALFLERVNGHDKLAVSTTPATYMRMHGVTGGVEIEGSNESMADLCSELSTVTQRPIIDVTGLSGVYTFTIVWSPENAKSGEDSSPSLYTALKESVGLHLRSGKAPSRYYVIDHVEQPSVN